MFITRKFLFLPGKKSTGNTFFLGLSLFCFFFCWVLLSGIVIQKECIRTIQYSRKKNQKQRGKLFTRRGEKQFNNFLSDKKIEKVSYLFFRFIFGLVFFIYFLFRIFIFIVGIDWLVHLMHEIDILNYKKQPNNQVSKVKPKYKRIIHSNKHTIKDHEQTKHISNFIGTVPKAKLLLFIRTINIIPIKIEVLPLIQAQTSRALIVRKGILLPVNLRKIQRKQVNSPL